MSEITPQELNLLIEQTYKVEKDFKELKKSYDNLQNTVEKVVEFLPNSIWIINEDGTIFLQNSKAREIDDILGLLELKRADDYEIEFNSRAYLIKTSTYQDKIMISATDITEQKRKENLATMGQMAAHLSHEIRNPIGAISLMSSTLKKRVIDKNIPIVEEIQKSIYKIERIIKATLMFSKGVKAQKKKFSWLGLRKSILENVSYYGYTKEIEFDLFDEDLVVYGDRDLLDMMFSNFIFNAIDAIELDELDDGKITLWHREDEDYHIFYVQDSGIAIPNPDELFEAFKSSKVKGNGLGLVLSRQIAQAHGGDVNLVDVDKKIFEMRLKKLG